MEYIIPLTESPRLRMIGIQSYKKGWKRTSSPKGNVCFLMLEGTFSFTVGNEVITARKNDIVLFKSRTEYCVCAESDCKYFYAHFASELSETEDGTCEEEYSLLFPQRISLEDFPEKRERLIWLLNLCLRVSVEKPVYASARLDNIFSEFLIAAASLHAEKRRAAIPPSIRRIEKFIKENAHLPLTLSDVSEKFTLSKQYIMRSFKAYYGTSVTHMINTEKLNRALILLRDSDMTVDEISACLSFSTSSYFCRLFKRSFALTPTEYRKQIIDG